MYRSIGINRTGVTTLCQIRSDAPEEVKGLEWVCFGSTAFATLLPIYPNVSRIPDYLSKVTLDVSTENLYWSSRLIGALADQDFADCVQEIERYEDAVMSEGRRLVLEFDRKIAETGSTALCEEANEALCRMCREQTVKTLNLVLRHVSEKMKNGFRLSDN